MALDDLAVQKLIVAEQKKGLFGKGAQARITDTGSRLLSFKKQELEAKSRDLESMYMNRDRRGVESFMDDNRAWIPMMIFSGILSAIMFASMMSFMGLAMNPAEAAAAMAGERLQTPTHRARQTLSRLIMITVSPADQEQISAPKSLLALILLVVILEVTLSFESWKPRQSDCWH